MELLLLLSALLSGLTGVMSGGREADVPQMERSASLQSVEAVVHVAEAVVTQPAAFALVILFALILFLRPLSRWRIKAPLLARYPAPKNERRLE